MFGQSVGPVRATKSSGLYAACGNPAILSASERQALEDERAELEKGYDRQPWPERVNRDARLGEIQGRLAADRVARGVAKRNEERVAERRQQGVANSAQPQGPQYMPVSSPHQEDHPAARQTDRVVTNCDPSPARRPVRRKRVRFERHPTKGPGWIVHEYIPLDDQTGAANLANRAVLNGAARTGGPVYMKPRPLD